MGAKGSSGGPGQRTCQGGRMEKDPRVQSSQGEHREGNVNASSNRATSPNSDATLIKLLKQ